jgi:DNA-binding NtrC family response regulator
VSALSILLVEDKDSLRAMLKLALESQGHHVIEARDEPEAVAALKDFQPALVLSDLRLPKGDGMGVLRAVKEVDAELPVIVMTAHGSIQDAVEAMKKGALDFLAKPVDPDHLLLLVSRALEQRRLLNDYRLLKEEAAARRGGPSIIGDAPALRQVMAAIDRAAGTDTTVLLEGESGTGKELCARALHNASARANGPFVAINCAAIPENLLEAELFGYERGAFTGANQRKIGKFEMAQHGTVFLDEIGEMPLALQAKMLRAIETKRIERLGGNGSFAVDVRIVAATNRMLRQAVASRQFREDLYFRLSVFPVTVPPLRDRKEDIPKLAHHFVERVARDVGKKVTISPEALAMLVEHTWPGNVRELQNAMERAVILADGDRLLPRHLNLMTQMGATADPWEMLDWSGTLADVAARFASEAEKRKIMLALKQGGGDKGRAADLLQINFKALAAKLRQYGLE